MDNPATWGAADAAFGRSFHPESWALFSLGLLSVILRYASRIRRGGMRGLQLDDFFILIALANFTVLCYGLNRLVDQGGMNNYMSEAMAASLTQTTRLHIVYNGKWIFAHEHLMLGVLWSAKVSLLIIFWRITEGLSVRKLVIIPLIWTACTFVACELSLIFTCFPVRRRWTIPSNSLNCSCYNNYQLSLVILSLSNSVLIFLTGIRIVMLVKLAPRQKWIVTILFSLGLFDIVACALKANYILNVSIYGFEFMSWYMRETTVALLVCNLPMVWSLLGDTFPGLKRWANQRDSSASTNFWPDSTRSLRSRISNLTGKKSWSASSNTNSPSGSPEPYKGSFDPTDGDSEKGSWKYAEKSLPTSNDV